MRAAEFIAGMCRQTWASVTRNKLRSFLTMFGIAWGMTSLAIMTAMGDGFRTGQRNYWKQIGTNVVLLFGGRTQRHAEGQTAGRYIKLYESDVEAIRRQCPDVRVVSYEVKRYGTPAESDYNSGRFATIGIPPEYLLMRTFPVETGRQINQADLTGGRRVCVLGATVRKQLFADRGDVLGREVRLAGYPYQVIGLMSEKRQSSSFDGWDNEKIVVPATSLRRDFPPSPGVGTEGEVSDIAYQPVSAMDWQTPQGQVKRVLGRLHNFDPEDEAAVHTIDYVRLMQIFDKTFETAERFLAFVALVTLVLGGVGVMNTMMMAVSERTNEIGLKKALGATRRRILADFFLEGVFLALMSGVAGMLFVSVLAAGVNSLHLDGMFAGLPIQARTLLIGATALGSVAILSALPPAWRAARLTPVEALRYER
jgi:putative ABC transport system permease protein